MFCPECNSLMRPKEDKWVCTTCNEVIDREEKKSNEIASDSDSNSNITKQPERDLPTTGSHCPVCGHDEAYYRPEEHNHLDNTAADVKNWVYRCTECGHTKKSMEIVDNPFYRQMAGDHHFEEGDFDRAMEHYKRAVEIDPENKHEYLSDLALKVIYEASESERNKVLKKTLDYWTDLMNSEDGVNDIFQG